MLKLRACALALVVFLALAGSAPAAPDPIDREAVDAWLVELGEALRSGDGDRVLDRMSPERLWEEIRAEGIPDLFSADEAAMIAGLRVGIRNQGSTWAKSLAFVRHEILDVKLRRDGSEATVLVRQWGEDGDSVVMRWWVARGPAGLLFYDFEDLMTSMRASFLMGAALSTGLEGGNRKVLDHMMTLAQAGNLLAAEDFARAGVLLDQIRDEPLPPVYEALKQSLLAAIGVWEEDPETALVHISRARALDADMPVLDYLEAVVQNQAGNHERALVCARAFLALLKDDPDGRREEGLALYDLGRREEAAAAFRAGLETDPLNLELMAGYGVALPAGTKGDFADRFAKWPDAPGSFESLVLEVQTWESPETERVLIARLRKIAPDDPNADYYEAELLVDEGEHEKAAQLLKGAIPRAPDDEREAYVGAYLGAMAALGRHIEAYLEFPGVNSFESLFSSIWHEGEEAGPLSGLIEAHAAQVADDPTLFLARAELRRREGDAKGAVEILLAHRDELGDRPDYIYEDMLIRALIALERFDEALAEARKSTDLDDDPWFEAVVLAAAKRPAELVVVLRRLKELGYSEVDFYGDEILGPALRTDPLADVRAEFPPPE